MVALVDSDINLCFCESCDSQAANAMAGDHSCASRMTWLRTAHDLNELQACQRLAHDEHPEACGKCDPLTCKLQSICAVPTCTIDVLSTMACDEKLGGCHTCAERIRYAADIKGLSPEGACERVGSEEFPEECGLCSSGGAVPHPSPAPISSPVLENLFMDESDNVCGASTCTRDVLESLACSDLLGGCFTCESRITYLINDMNYEPKEACRTIGLEQFMGVCGGCIPDDFRTPGKSPCAKPRCEGQSQVPSFTHHSVVAVRISVEPVDPKKLVWSDEFDYEGAPDPSKWTYDVGTGTWGWGNNEMQYYTDRTDNAFVMDGMLHIRAVKETYQGMKYTSARIKTKNLGDWTYGRIQIRTRLANAAARGTWSALWMLPTDNIYGGWPDSGEIDIMEHVGYDAGNFHGTIHSAAYNHMLGTQNGGQVLDDEDEWHVYEIDWNEDKIDFILDGSRFHTFERKSDDSFREWPFDQDFHLIFNIAVGGTWGGVKGIDEKAFEGVGQVMEVDWVRVYRQ